MENLKNYNLFITHKTRAIRLNAEQQNKYLLVEAKKQKDIKFENIQFDVKKVTDKFILLKLTTFASRCSELKSYLQYIFYGETLTLNERIEGVSSQYIFSYTDWMTSKDIENLEKEEQNKKHFC